MAGFTLPAPNKGLDLSSPIDNMDPASALELVNIYPESQAPIVRSGYGNGVSTGVGTQLGFLRELPLSTGVNKIVGGDATKLWEFSTGAAVNITGATIPLNGNWNTEAFAHRLFMCNGANTPQVYDGSTTTDITFTGPTLANLINVSSYKERLWFWEKNSMIGWYGNTQAVGASALTSNDFKYAFKRGGYVMFSGSYTNQTAQTSAELFYVVSSEGEVLFYQGSSPADTANWGIVARAVIGKPLGYRAQIRVNNDVWIITYQGIWPLSAVFAPDPSAASDYVGVKINPLISEAAATIGISPLWHGIHWPQGRRVLIILPTSDSTSTLLVCSLDGEPAWTSYEFYDSGACVAITKCNELIYYGSSQGTCFQGEYGGNDNGNAIAFNARLAFNFFNSRANFKNFTDIRPLMKGPPSITLGLGIDTNFQRLPDLSTITTASGTFTPYGSLYGSLYSSGVGYIYERFATKGQGHCGAVRIQGSILDTSLEFYGFEVRFKVDGEI